MNKNLLIIISSCLIISILGLSLLVFEMNYKRCELFLNTKGCDFTELIKKYCG